jgi:hypothetical protein
VGPGQQAVIGPWRMPSIMYRIVPVGLGAAAVVGLLVVGGSVLGTPSSDSAGVGAAPTASPQVPPAQIPRSGPIDAGTYPVSDGRSTIRVTFPAGWARSSTNTFWKGRGNGARRDGRGPRRAPGHHRLDPVRGSALTTRAPFSLEPNITCIIGSGISAGLSRIRGVAT